MINNVEHLSICFLACEMSIHIFFPFSFWVVCLIESFVDIMKSSVRRVKNIYSPLMSWIYFLTASFWKQKVFFILIKSSLSELPFMKRKYVLFNTSLLTPSSQRFSPTFPTVDFIILYFTFRSINLFQVNFYVCCEIRVELTFFPYTCPIFLAPFAVKTIIFAIK